MWKIYLRRFQSNKQDLVVILLIRINYTVSGTLTRCHQHDPYLVLLTFAKSEIKQRANYQAQILQRKRFKFVSIHVNQNRDRKERLIRTSIFGENAMKRLLQQTVSETSTNRSADRRDSADTLADYRRPFASLQEICRFFYF